MHAPRLVGVRVRVVRVNLEQAKIDFVLVEGTDEAPKTGRRGGAKKPRDIDKKMSKLERFK